jgi:preprotein translocase subunit SecG
MVLLALSWTHYFFMIPLMILSVFMVLVILVQRGRGGGLTGALGGMGGQSAFGTKAGDLFTRITIVVAAIWVLLSMASLKVLNPHTVAGFDPNIRGKETPISKTGEGGLLPSATKSAETPAGNEGETAPATGATAEVPPASSSTKSDATAAPATTSTDAGAKSADASKP